MSAVLEAAKRWTDLGQVALALGGDDGKMPMGKAWQKRTETNLLFFNRPDVTGVGLLLGRGYVDIDLDGLTEDDDLGDLPPTAAFGRGGEVRHLLYRYEGDPKKTRKWKDPVTDEMIVEFRCKGAQTMIPPSLHRESGQQVEWMNDALPALVNLDDLEQRVDRIFRRAMERRGHTKSSKVEKPKPARPASKSKRTGTREQKYVGGAIDKAAAAVRTAGEGGRNDTLNSEAFALAKLVIGRPEESDARLALRNAALSAGLGESEVDATMVSAWTAAEGEPRRAIPEPKNTMMTKHIPGPEDDWESGLVTTMSRAGTVVEPILANVVLVLENDPAWSGAIAFDDFVYAITVRRELPYKRGDGDPWDDSDDAEVAIWMQRSRYAMKVSTDTAAKAVQVVARKHRFDSLRDDMQRMANAWDREPRLATLGVRYLGAKDTPHNRRACEVWALALAARGLKPGCKADLVLIAEGDQGIKKSTAFRVLAGDDRFTDEIADFGTKDAAVQLQGVHVVEIAELENMDRSSVGRIKAFFSKTDDRYVPKYARHAVRVPRRCVFVGTANGNTWGRDETGARRFLAVEIVHEPDVDGIARDRVQILGEAAARILTGESWWLEGDEAQVARAEADARYQGDAWEEEIEVLLTGRTSGVSVADVLRHLYRDDRDNIHVTKWSQADQNRVARALRRLGWERRRDNWVDGKRSWRYYPRTNRDNANRDGGLGRAEAGKTSPRPTVPVCPSSDERVGGRIDGDGSGGGPELPQGGCGGTGATGTAGTPGQPEDFDPELFDPEAA